MPGELRRPSRARAIALLVTVGIAALAVGGALFLGLPDLALQLSSMLGGWLLGYGAAWLLPSRRRALLIVAASLFVATVCGAFLAVGGDLPAWEISGESAWTLVFRASLWFGLGVFMGTLPDRTANRTG